MTNRDLDEYKNVKFYADNTTAKQSGFSKFEDGDDFYFCRYIDGDIAMLSQAYVSIAGRDNGIESVKKNEKIAKRFVFENRGGNRHGFALKAGNGQEIAISPDYASRGQAERVAGRMSGAIKSSAAPKKPAPKKAAPKAKTKKAAASKPAAKVAFTSSDSRVENYKPLAFYQTYGGRANGFNRFERDGAYYFHYNQGGDIVLISESYTSAAGRDNGIASVTKNMKRAAAYQHHQHKNGQYYFDLNAGNHQEIATSVWYNSKSRAVKGAANLRGGTPKPRAVSRARSAAKPRAGSGEQNYMPLAFYANATKGKTKGFESFKGDDGEHYFTYFENDRIALISEGYPTAAIRDKGLASVQKNMRTESRYLFGKGADGKEGFALRAGNNKEIARSVGYGSAAGAVAGAAYLIGTRRRVASRTVRPTPVRPKTVKTTAAKPKAVKTRVTKPKTVKPKTVKPKTVKPKTAKPKVAKPAAAAALAAGSIAASKPKITKPKTPVKKTTVKKKKPSVAPLAAGSVAIAGLGAAAAVAKTNAVKKAAVPVKAAAIKPQPVAAPIAAAALGTAGAARMAARSKVAAPVAAAPVAATPAVAPVAATATAAPVAAATASVSAAPAAAVAATGGGGIWGWLKWLLLALLALFAMFFLFKACAGGAKDISVPPVASTAETAAPAAMVTCWNGTKARNDQSCPTKITCWDDSFATSQSACPVQPAPAPEPTPAPATTAGTTIASAAPSVSVANATSAPAPIKMTAPLVDGRICGPSANVLFDVRNSTPISVGRLGTNPQFGDSRNYTSDDFFRRLEVKYRTSPRDKSFLDLLARSLGHGSFANMDASMFSNETLAQGTSGLLGFGSQHALQYSTLNVTDQSDLEAFRVRSANGTDVHFMKRCGNFMYVCQP